MDDADTMRSTDSADSDLSHPPEDQGPHAEAEHASDPTVPTSEPGTSAERELPDPIPHAGARYAGLRLLMLATVGGVLYLVGLRGWLLAFAAVLLSGIVSLFLFMKQRNDAAVNLEHTVDHWKHRHEDEGDAPLA